jgi:hypothetical protein
MVAVYFAIVFILPIYGFFFCDRQVFLTLFSLWIFFHEEDLPGERVSAGIKHQSRVGGWSGSEDLYLFWMGFQFGGDEPVESLHVLMIATGMSGDEVIGEKLVFPELPVQLIKYGFERRQVRLYRLSHETEDFLFSVLRCDLQLSGGVVAEDFLQVFHPKRLVFHYQVVSNSGGDKNLLYARNLSQSLQETDLPLMIRLKIFTPNREQTTLFETASILLAVQTVHAVHVGSRPPNIRDVTLKTG